MSPLKMPGIRGVLPISLWRFLRDMQDLYLMASACDISWTMIGQAAQGVRDRELLEVVDGRLSE